MKRQKAVLLAEGQTRGRADEDANIVRLNTVRRGITNTVASEPVRVTQGCSWSLQIAVRLTPPIFVDDIGERDTANRPEPAHGVADRQQSI